MLVPARALAGIPASYLVNFNGQQRIAGGLRFRLGQSPHSGPVAQKVVVHGDPTREAAASTRLLRERDIARYLGSRGGELFSRCVGYNFDQSPASALVTYHGRPLTELAANETAWPPDHATRTKMATDLLRGLELLRVAGVVHGNIDLDTLCWDGTTLQLTEFGHAALCGKYPDDRPARHGDDILAAGRVIYQLYSGQVPPTDPAELRHQTEHVQDSELRDLFLQRDWVTGDVYYVFAASAAERPTARMLLDRLDKRPHGTQWNQLVERDQRARASFRQLRERQQQVRHLYGDHGPQHFGPFRTAQPDHFGSAPGGAPPVPPRRPPRPWLVVTAAAGLGLVVACLLLLGVL